MSTIMKPADRFADVRAALHDRGSSEEECKLETLEAATRVVSELGEAWAGSDENRADHSRALAIIEAMTRDDFQAAVSILQG